MTMILFMIAQTAYSRTAARLENLLQMQIVHMGIYGQSLYGARLCLIKKAPNFSAFR